MPSLQRIKSWLNAEDGATAIEYSLIAGAMGVVLLPASSSLSDLTSDLFTTVIDLFDTF